MNLQNYKEVGFLEVAEIERSKKGKIYPKGNILIQLSASDGQCLCLEEAQEVADKYGVVTAKNIDSKYLYFILKNALSSFLQKYQDNINVNPEVFKFLKLKIHSDLETQKYIVKMFDVLDKQIENEKLIMDEIKDLKKYHLEKMFC